MKKIIGVMGPGRLASTQLERTAFKVGCYIAEAGHILLTGGVAHGVMNHASRGAKDVGGIVVGVLPHKSPSVTHPVSDYVDIPIITSFGEGRNIINILSSHLVIAIGMCPGTASEICFAVKNEKPVILMEFDQCTEDFFRETLKGKIYTADTSTIRTMLRSISY